MIGIDTLVAAAETDAVAWDESGLPTEVIDAAARAGVLGLDRTPACKGLGLSAAELGSVAERLGAVCTSLRSLLTVQGMVNAALDRWGSAEQREQWLPVLTTGELLAGFAATEAGAGTELSCVATTFDPAGSDYRVSGRKLWVTYGQVADVLLVLGQTSGGLTTALVETSSPGVTVEPVHGQLGMRGTRVAHIELDNVSIPATHVIAPPGFGLSHVTGTALDHGRYTIAWGCAGMARACLADAVAHASTRVQGTAVLSEQDAVRSMIGRGWVEVAGARALCERAAQERDAREHTALFTTVAAKYAAARAAVTLSQQGVQILGATGCAGDSRVGRFFRDAKVMQIIEGATEVAELQIGEYVLAGGVR
ncbi:MULTISPECIES: acyl-CoA dehydrogenase family protein [Rhodococcus]|uniref:Acyl-CoA dehydrogenase family protein n=1 Tax=Rhodococcus oxybenzonivorans TaxID=1990687 RepID=A0AAE4V3Q6_9NOCA|nr:MULTISPECIES: acyl-CoA dehydrogenase family protein [Rhodococcus]MDV7240653.1 acyl-CoA dehydrogenase family protein [Rhodococcus oxybenzonivorans]MDV7267209.1 acyl-CoA dehydrogenase family protein [Rhodococcus oxybenzonivorans]MDV7272926.1 acyl-CoA dehydrogenase family protein [Rhodococcus oxybenzonivorans]MDV7333335.1 acyl-CoA dehydrogenase family protein [Rhodococcus oxybenzonivorans]MDV7342502.1 acyl-CoA dehydrogenase family protein [Rhodococcus oxybenzonivorans]